MVDIIDPEDLESKVYPYDENPGGQHVGVKPGIKITHLPSGLIAISDIERSQHRNKNIAMDMIIGGLTSPHFRGTR